MFITNTFVHHVHFWLKDKADLPKLIEGLKALAEIKYIKKINIGVPADTHREVVERTYDASLLIFFDSQADHDAYQIDAEHDVFIANYAKPLCQKVLVFDSVDA